MPASKPTIGISSCLLGEHVRYDGNHKHAPSIIEALSPHFSFRSFCPEVAIGLGIPRKPIHLIKIDKLIHCVSVSEPTQDVTEALVQCGNNQNWHNEICGYLVKSKSPSCGKQGVPITSKTNGQDLSGPGLYTQQLISKFPGLPIMEEHLLLNPATNNTHLTDFIQKALAFAKANENRFH